MPLTRISTVILTLALAAFLAGCAPPPISGDPIAGAARSRRLASLAVEEAQQIPDADKRLTRELNLANLQIEHDWQSEARSTLLLASNTLLSPDGAKLSEHARLSGWVSISELSRQIKDHKTATAATSTALAELMKINDPAHRCDYVMGLANELQYTQGKPAAASLLSEAGPWTRSIDSIPKRQAAVTAFATALFNVDDFSDGRKMVDYESDPAWRSDVLEKMARATSEGPFGFISAAPLATVSGGSRYESPATQPFYGEPLSYDEVFKNKQSSQISPK